VKTLVSKLSNSDLAIALSLTAIGAALRLQAQGGTLLYPDSYQFLLLAKGLVEGSPVSPLMGADGDTWAIPFYKLGYAVFSAPLVGIGLSPRSAGEIVSFVAGCASVPAIYYTLVISGRSRVAAIGGAVAMALSFSAAGWSRFVMAESLAICLAAFTLLLATLTGYRRSHFFAICTAIVGAIMVLVRMELVILIPVALVLSRNHYVRDWRFERRYLITPFLVAFVILAIVLAWLAQHVAEAFTLNPEFYVRASIARIVDGQESGSRGLYGLWSFIRHEPLLLTLGATAFLAELRSKKLALDPMYWGIALLLLVAIPRNDVRFFASLIPVLALVAGRGAVVWWHLLERAARLPSVAAAASLTGLMFLMAVMIGGAQVNASLSDWHLTESYEAQAIGLLEGRLEMMDITPDVICSYSPEAYYLLTGRSSRRLTQQGLSSCLDDRLDESMLLVIDEPARLKAGLKEAELDEQWRFLFSQGLTASYVDGHDVYVLTQDVSVYIRR
jgi:hypothetical protein